MIDGTAEGDVLCGNFVSDLLIAEMPRVPIDKQGLRAAAEEIVRFESAQGIAIAFATGDPRLAPFLKAAIARRKAARDERLQGQIRL